MSRDRRALWLGMLPRAAGMLLLAVSGSGCWSTYSCDLECQQKREANAACNAGNAQACERLGRYAHACKHGSAYGCYRSAEKLDPRETSIDGDAAQAARYYERACDGGRSRACLRGATLLMAKPGAASGAGRKLLERACSDAGTEACVKSERQWLSQQGGGVEAVDEGRFRLRCSEVYAEACRELSLALADGIDGEVDDGRALTLMQAACRVGDAEACMFEGYYHYAAIGIPRDEAAALSQFDDSCKAEVGDACSAAAVLRDETPPGMVRVLARLIDEERNLFGHRAQAVQPHGLPPVKLAVQALSFISMSGTVSFSGGRMTAVQGRVVSASPTRMTLAEQRYQNILRVGYTAGSLMLLEWAAPNPSLQDSDCADTEDCKTRDMCVARGGYCLPPRSAVTD